MKKLVLILFCAILITSLIAAESINIEFPNGNEFESGQPITFKVTLYNDAGTPINGQINVLVEDSEKRIIIQKEVNSREVASFELGNSANSGQGIITASYGDIKAIEFFDIGEKELASFILDGNNLKVTNIGNTLYSRTITITIGNTIGTKTPNLGIGEPITYRLVAPDGVYNIKVSDGKTTLTKGNIQLTGTGNAIGALEPTSRAPLTGGVSPDEKSSEITLLSYVKNNSFVYVFVVIIFCAMILVAIERNYRNKTQVNVAVKNKVVSKSRLK